MNDSMKRGRNGRRRGAMMIFVGVTMVAVLGILALTLDIGAGNRQRRIAQTAADAGATAGATQLWRGMDDATVRAAALRMATTNGFASGDVNIYHPPVSGIYTDSLNYVEVVISKSVPTIFGGIFNKSTISVQARGVAGLANSLYCVYGLGRVGASVSSEGDLIANCQVIANGDVSVKKNFVAPALSLRGDFSGSSQNLGQILYDIPEVPDPLAYLTVPPETICNYTNTVVTVDIVLSPGVYCGGIYIDKGRATLSPGTYILRGGGLTGGEISGTGVTIINTNGMGNNVAAFRPISFGSSCFVGLTAPTSGPYKGIVIFQDPAGPSSGPNTKNDICGKGPGDPDIVGTLYFPTQELDLGNSNGKFVIEGTIVAKVITASSGGTEYTIRNPTAANAVVKRPALVQ